MVEYAGEFSMIQSSISGFAVPLSLGEIVDMTTAKQREQTYEKTGAGCFMFYFWFEGYQYW